MKIIHGPQCDPLRTDKSVSLILDYEDLSGDNVELQTEQSLDEVFVQDSNSFKIITSCIEIAGNFCDNGFIRKEANKLITENASTDELLPNANDVAELARKIIRITKSIPWTILLVDVSAPPTLNQNLNELLLNFSSDALI